MRRLTALCPVVPARRVARVIVGLVLMQRERPGEPLADMRPQLLQLVDEPIAPCVAIHASPGRPLDDSSTFGVPTLGRTLRAPGTRLGVSVLTVPPFILSVRSVLDFAIVDEIEGVFQAASENGVEVLKGANPGDLPIGKPSDFELSANLKLAQALGVTLPDFVLSRATRLIQ